VGSQSYNKCQKTEVDIRWNNSGWFLNLIVTALYFSICFKFTLNLQRKSNKFYDFLNVSLNPLDSDAILQAILQFPFHSCFQWLIIFNGILQNHLQKRVSKAISGTQVLRNIHRKLQVRLSPGLYAKDDFPSTSSSLKSIAMMILCSEKENKGMDGSYRYGADRQTAYPSLQATFSQYF
jgi:hypothetical protein